MSRIPARRSAAVVGALAFAALVSCHESTLGPGTPQEVEARLFEAMNTDDYASAGDLVGELLEIRDAKPENGRNTFLLGAASLWWLAEVSHPGANPLLITAQAIPLIIESFPDVIQNDPANRAGASALLGAFLADGGFDFAQGSALIEQAVLQKPEVGLFQRMHIRRFAFADDPETDYAVNAGFEFWELCAGGITLDRANPDYSAYVQQPTSDDQLRFCFGSDRVPHGYEGAWLIFGDLLVKQGEIAAAQQAYVNATLGPNFSQWRYKSVVTQRLASDLNARNATYASRYMDQWAPIGIPEFGCTQCHASVAH